MKQSPQDTALGTPSRPDVPLASDTGTVGSSSCVSTGKDLKI